MLKKIKGSYLWFVKIQNFKIFDEIFTLKLENCIKDIPEKIGE